MLNEDLSVLKKQNELKSDFSSDKRKKLSLSEASRAQAAARWKTIGWMNCELMMMMIQMMMMKKWHEEDVFPTMLWFKPVNNHSFIRQ